MVWEVRTTGSDSNGGGFRGGATLTTPSSPTVAAASGGSVSAATYYIVVTETDGNGETPKSAESSVATSGGNLTITVTSPTNPSSQGSTWSVYVGTASGGPYFSQGTGLAFGSNRSITTTPPTSGTQVPGVDYSQQDGIQVTINNSTITCTTPSANSNTLTFTLGYVPTAADVGNIVNITAGTNINAARYEITGWTSTTWTLAGVANLTTAGGAGSAITGNMGGSLASPGMVGAVAVSGNGIFIKYNASAYTATSTNNVAGGAFLNGNPFYVSGYNTTRSRNNSDPLRPTINASSNSMTIITGGGNNHMLANLIVSANGHTSVTGFSTGGGTNAIWYNLKAASCATGFTAGSSFIHHESCEANACATGFTTSSNVFYHACVAISSTTVGFVTGGNLQVYSNCLALNGTGSSNGFTCGSSALYFNCTAYGNAGNGFSINVGGAQGSCVNCVSYSNTGTGFGMGSTSNNVGSTLLNCASGGNGTNVASGWTAAQQPGFVTLTADPFTNAAGNDFSLNTTAGGGTALRAVGYPTSFSGLSTNSYSDIGAVQHADPSNVLFGKGIRSGGGI